VVFCQFLHPRRIVDARATPTITPIRSPTPIGVQPREQGAGEYDEVGGIDWSFLSADGAMRKFRWETRRPARIPLTGPRGGVKRSVLTEAAGVPVGLDHDGANRNDHKLLNGTLDSIPIERPEPTPEQPQGICLDTAYDNAVVRELIGDSELTPHIRGRGEEIDLKAQNPEWKHAAGSSRPATPGRTATAGSSSASQRRTRTTSRYSSSQATSSHTRRHSSRPSPLPNRDRP
jgi:hypothetical protein